MVCNGIYSIIKPIYKWMMTGGTPSWRNGNLRQLQAASSCRPGSTPGKKGSPPADCSLEFLGIQRWPENPMAKNLGEIYSTKTSKFLGKAIRNVPFLGVCWVPTEEVLEALPRTGESWRWKWAELILEVFCSTSSTDLSKDLYIMSIVRSCISSLCYIALHCTTFHCITLHYITLHYIALHYISLA